MTDISKILALIKIFIFALNIFLSLIYSLSILLIRRFQHRSNILTLNLSLAFMCCCFYWLVYCIVWDYYTDYLFDINICNFLTYAQIICTCQLAFAFVIIPINRLCSIVYHTKLFFKRKSWIIICVAIQWIFGFLVALPLVSTQLSSCARPYWISIYQMIMIVVIPSLISLCVNGCVLIHIRSLVRHVQCQSQIEQTNTSTTYQPRISHHDIRLLRHMIYMFCIFIVGWGPVFILIAIDHEGIISPIIYIILAFIAEASLLSIIINLFKYNLKLRQYLKSIVPQCC